jgi:Holliday junction resolvasome RuvABC endonuclease subunit
MAKYTIIGFDPASTRNIGWAVIELDKKPSKTAKIHSWECGTFVMPNVEERWQILWPMFMLTEAFLEDNKPHLVIVEQTNSFGGRRNMFITGQVSHCMGVMLAACGKHEIDVEFVFPTSVKKLVSNNGRAKKPLMKKSTHKLLEMAGVENIKFDSEHAADATANILYWLIKNDIISPIKEQDNG